MYISIVWVIVISISVIYFTTILLLLLGWLKITVYKKQNRSLSTKVSVIVPVRNEEKNIRNLLGDILDQDVSKELLEIIIVNDNSEDNTQKIVEEYLFKNNNIKLLQLESVTGKKNALSKGILNAKGSLIITTDADCRFNSEWISTIVEFYEKQKPKMIIGPVAMKSNSLFGDFQSLEFMSLVSSGAGAVGLKSPIMCNGANLAFEKNIFLEMNMNDNKNIASGDDVFLLHKIKKSYNGKIAFLKSQNAIVTTRAMESLKDFIYQRIRWTSKSKVYKDFFTIYIAIIILLTNIFLLLLLIFSIFDFRFLFMFLALFGSKSLIDFTFLSSSAGFYDKNKLLFMFLPLQTLYFIYISFIGVIGNFMPYYWKNRKIKA